MYLKSEKGATLVMVVLIGLMATVLGTALYQVNTVNAKQEQIVQDNSQAKYFAQSGVDLAVGYIKKNPDVDYSQYVWFRGTIDGDYEMFAPGSDKPSDAEMADCDMVFGIILKGENYYVDSTGIVRSGSAEGATAASATSTKSDAAVAVPKQAVQRSVTETDKIVYLPQYALFANEGITFNKYANITGDAGTNATSWNSVVFQPKTQLIGDLYVGYGGNVNNVVKIPTWLEWNIWAAFNLDDYVLLGGGLYPGNITNYITGGTISNLTSELNYTMPEFPEFPSDLPDRNDINLTSWIPCHGWWNVLSWHNWRGWENINYSTEIPSPWIAENYTHYKRIEEDGSFNNIQVPSGKILIIDTGQNPEGFRKIRIKNKLQVDGAVVLQGQGKLILYVEKEFSMGSNKNKAGRLNSMGDPQDVLMYYKGNGDQKNRDIDLSGATAFVGSIFAETADTTLDGNGEIKGDIITGGASVKVNDVADVYSRIIYAPNAHVQVTGCGEIRGTVICNKCTVGGHPYALNAEGEYITIQRRNAIYVAAVDTTFYDMVWNDSGIDEEDIPELLSGNTGTETYWYWKTQTSTVTADET